MKSMFFCRCIFTNKYPLCSLAGLLATAASAALNNASGSYVGRQVIGGSCENSSEQEAQSQTGVQTAEYFYFLCTFLHGLNLNLAMLTCYLTCTGMTGINSCKKKNLKKVV